jgi:hypothetical protein
MSIDVISFILGGLLVAVAILGGGIEVREIKIPAVGRTARVLSFLGGLAFIALAIFVSRQSRNETETRERPAFADRSTSRERQTFFTPMQDELRLDHCHEWSNRCGDDAANAWCKTKGFERASSDHPVERVGTRGTKLIGTGQVCNVDACTAFKYITCER